MSGSQQSNQQQPRTGRSGGGLPPPAFDPAHPALVQPWKRLVEEGFIVKLNVEFTPFGVNLSGQPGPALCALQGGVFASGVDYPLGVLESACAKHGFGARQKTVSRKTVASAGPSVVLPLKSLCKSDFDGKTATQLAVRAAAVAEACGGNTLTGRVRSAGLFSGSETTSFQSWWQTAPVASRLVALTDGHRRKQIEEAGLAVDAVGQIQCPFRGDAVFVVSARAEEAEEGQVPPPAASN